MHAPAFASSLARSLAAPRASASASRRAPESRRRERRTASTAATSHDVPSSRRPSRRLVVALDDAAAAADPVHRSAASASRRAALATIALASAATAAARAPYPARALVDDANARRVFEQSRRSVVGLADYTPGGANGGYAPRGTGVVWAALQQQPGDDDVGVGYVVTNYHVIAPDHLPGRNDDGGKKGSAPAGGPALRVAVADAKTGEPAWYDAVVVGTQRASDVAVLRVRLADKTRAGDSSVALAPVKVGTSGDLRVGQTCYAVGAGDAGLAAGGAGRSSSSSASTSSSASFRQLVTMSAGVVSGLHRSVPTKNATTVRGAIQTDAKVPETAAGGALLDSGGRLIGLTVTPYGKGQAGVGFAVAVDDLMQVVPSLITLRQIS
jgi:S1-C subfamily serine protease